MNTAPTQILSLGRQAHCDSGAPFCIATRFDDESFVLRHDGPGLLSMANSGPNTNGCQFFLTCAKCDWLDGKHVVFGKVLDPASLMVLRKIENIPTDPKSSKPKLPVIIAQCGEL